MRTDTWSDGVGQEILEGLRTRNLPLEPLDVRVQEVTDGFDEPAWRVVLSLPAPSSQTWDRTDVFTLRRATISLLDDLAERDARSLPGSTIAVLTTDASDAETAAPDPEPERGEGLADDEGSAT